MTIIIDLVTGSSLANLGQLRTQLRERGFNFLEDAECDRLLNDAYLEICDLDDWPFLQATATGPASLTIADLRTVTSVYDTTGRRHLDVTSYDELIQQCVDVTQAGTPCVYWIDGLTVVKTWPVGGTLSVRYLKTPTAMVDPAEQPVIPARFRDIIVTGAARKAAMDQSAAADLDALTQEYQRRLEVMRAALIDQSRDTQFLRTAGGDDWGSWCR